MFSYVVANDYGFAPNPYGGVLTLATCKPVIRRTARVGDIIVGLGSKRTVGNDKLVYAGIISEIVTMKEYGESERFANKRPENMKSGDCIYYWDESGINLRPNPIHSNSDIATDTNGKNVLVCEEFWYFGSRAIEIPPTILDFVKVIRGHRKIQEGDNASALQSYLYNFKIGIDGEPFHSIKKEKRHCGTKTIKNNCAR
ncbi:hypothetical protein [Pseudoalteromonas luteoviolacea]|uniref:Nmad2 family putative nucleotide modification protein n=1 Tax=Pseudoalteromonas luteoviolacea TaxID=43657 RepID=UPI001FD4F3E5|nr:hypothetical protein [Pseudoalteromonas luteoviolacea]